MTLLGSCQEERELDECIVLHSKSFSLPPGKLSMSPCLVRPEMMWFSLGRLVACRLLTGVGIVLGRGAVAMSTAQRVRYALHGVGFSSLTLSPSSSGLLIGIPPFSGEIKGGPRIVAHDLGQDLCRSGLRRSSSVRHDFLLML